MINRISLAVCCAIITFISNSQLTKPLPYYQRLQEQGDIKAKAEKGLKKIMVYENEVLVSEEKLDKKGNTILLKGYHFDSGANSYLARENDSLFSKRLKNEWLFTYDKYNNMLTASNKHEIISKTTFDRGRGESGQNGLPNQACPCRLTEINQSTEWKYKYDKQGRPIEKTGIVSRTTNTNSLARLDAAQKWKVKSVYDDNGNLIKQKEYYPHNSKEPLFVRKIKYNEQNQIIKEQLFSGENLNKEFTFFYNKKNQLIEKKIKYSYVYHYEYDEFGNNTSVKMIYTKNNITVLKHQMIYDSNQNLIEDKFVGTRQNQEQKNATYSYELDSKNRIIKKIKTTIDKKQFTYIYQYFDMVSDK